MKFASELAELRYLFVAIGLEGLTVRPQRWGMGNEQPNTVSTSVLITEEGDCGTSYTNVVTSLIVIAVLVLIIAAAVALAVSKK